MTSNYKIVLVDVTGGHGGTPKTLELSAAWYAEIGASLPDVAARIGKCRIYYQVYRRGRLIKTGITEDVKPHRITQKI